ncbi:MAG: hypothetical protein M1814_001512 [Vezdaea aestivalis]|nr:MAG: hypothetical protein M1814_001512 [Vezdaea aestivalis]
MHRCLYSRVYLSVNDISKADSQFRKFLKELDGLIDKGEGLSCVECIKELTFYDTRGQRQPLGTKHWIFLMSYIIELIKIAPNLQTFRWESELPLTFSVFAVLESSMRLQRLQVNLDPLGSEAHHLIAQSGSASSILIFDHLPSTSERFKRIGSSVKIDVAHPNASAETIVSLLALLKKFSSIDTLHVAGRRGKISNARNLDRGVFLRSTEYRSIRVRNLILSWTGSFAYTLTRALTGISSLTLDWVWDIRAALVPLSYDARRLQTFRAIFGPTWWERNVDPPILEEQRADMQYMLDFLCAPKMHLKTLDLSACFSTDDLQGSFNAAVLNSLPTLRQLTAVDFADVFRAGEVCEIGTVGTELLDLRINLPPENPIRSTDSFWTKLISCLQSFPKLRILTLLAPLESEVENDDFVLRHDRIMTSRAAGVFVAAAAALAEKHGQLRAFVIRDGAQTQWWGFEEEPHPAKVLWSSVESKTGVYNPVLRAEYEIPTYKGFLDMLDSLSLAVKSLGPKPVARDQWYPDGVEQDFGMELNEHFSESTRGGKGEQNQPRIEAGRPAQQQLALADFWPTSVIL